MPPAERLVPRFAAEPPQEGLPYGRRADVLREQFLVACERAAPDEELGEIRWHPDRAWGGHTYVPASAPTQSGRECFGFVSFPTGTEHFAARADVTDETAEANPEWTLDLADEVVGAWRGEEGRTAEMTLVWGRAMVTGGALVTAELADLAVDQCVLTAEGRFTLLAPDAYRGDLLDVKLWSAKGEELARESLYVEDEEEEEEEDGQEA